MNKREAAFTTRFLRWVHYKWDYGTCIFEAKVARDGNRIPLAEIKEHQIDRLKKAGGFAYKFSDFARVGTPCDGVICDKKTTKGILVFNFLGKEFYVFEINRFLETIPHLPMKSITEEECKKYANWSGTLQS